jgi:predicted Zn-dependent peptidase
MNVRMTARTLGLAAALLALVALPASAQDVASFEKNLTVHKLDNGLTFLIYERPAAPVVSFFTHVDAGGAQEVPGITGLAHMFEHMAFKGTSRIGTTDAVAEKAALAKVDEAYFAYDRERRKLGGPDAEKLKGLEKAWKDAQEEAGKFIKVNEFGEIIDREGGTGLNAFTNSDETGYFFSLPANKVELWCYLESERFLDPVFREFYKERDVVMEERRLRTESNPIGRMIEQFGMVAFSSHPYKQPVVGYMSDLMSFSVQDGQAFFRKYYVPANMTVAIVGDVKAKEIVPILDKYFGRLPKAPKPDPLRTVEPPQIAEKTIVIPDKAQPVYVEGYHKPASGHPDDAVFQAMSDILSSGRTSRLYRSLVRDKKLAAQTGAFPGYPGDKYPNLMLFFAIPAPGATNLQVQEAIREEIAKIQSEPVTDEELARVKTQAKANLIRGLDDNQGLAIQLASAQARYGDWREIFRAVDKIDKVTKEDIQRVAKATFVKNNRTVAMLENSDAAASN